MPAASRQAAKQEVMTGEQAGPPLRHPTGGGVSMLAPAALGLAVCLPALLTLHCRQAALDRSETVSHTCPTEASLLTMLSESRSPL